MADRLERAGMGVYCAERLDDMLGFWQSFQELAEELSGSLIADVGEFAESVSRMYDPQLQVMSSHIRLKAGLHERTVSDLSADTTSCDIAVQELVV